MPNPQNPQKNKGKKEEKDTVMITLMVPKDLLATVDRAVELGYFPSRSEAIREGLRRLLKSLLFTLEPINVLDEKLKNNPPKEGMPPEVFFMKYALDYITENPVTEDFFTDYAGFITQTTMLLKSNRKEDVRDLIKTIKEVVE